MYVTQNIQARFRGPLVRLQLLCVTATKILLLLSLCIVFCTLPARAADVPSPADMRLSLSARSAISEDFRFYYLNLSVPVKDGVATIHGPVPSFEMTQQIVDRVGKVKGIKSVRNEMTVLSEEDWPDDWRDVQPILRPLGLRAKPGEQVAISLRPPTPLDESVPSTGGVPSAPAPNSLAPGQLAAQERKPDLRATLDEVKKSDARFDGITIVTEGDIVYLRGQGAILFTLAERISVLPGVERVIVQMQK